MPGSNNLEVYSLKLKLIIQYVWCESLIVHTPKIVYKMWEIIKHRAVFSEYKVQGCVKSDI